MKSKLLSDGLINESSNTLSNKRKIYFTEIKFLERTYYFKDYIKIWKCTLIALYNVLKEMNGVLGHLCAHRG